MSANSSIFSGSSRYATDFQSVIDRAVAIASLPMSQMQSARAQLSDESSALKALDAKFVAVSYALSGLERITGNSGLSSVVSDPAAVKATVAEGALEGSYSLRVVDLGAFSSVMSSTGLPLVSDPAQTGISTSTTYTLTVGTSSYDITADSASLTDLAAAINAQAGSDVSATVVNVGSGSTDYRLSLESKTLGSVDLQLNDGTSDLLDTSETLNSTLVTGSKAKYKVGSSPVELESSSRTITLSTGLTVEMLEETADSVAITVNRSAASVSSALGSFITAYNAATDELDNHRGQDGGKLAGQSIVASLGSSLRQVLNYTASSGTVTSLGDLGLEVDQDGKLSLNGTKFQTATEQGLETVLEFLGSSTGGGFLQAATEVFESIEDSSTGTLGTAISGNAASITAQDKRLEVEQERIDALRERLNEQMARSDALIAQMEQQVQYFTSMFEAMAAAQKQMS